MRRLAIGLALAGAALAAAPAEAATPRPPPRPHVVLIVFDELPTDSLLGPDGRIDAARFPNFAQLAREATWFPNATTVGDWTWHALPPMLTGLNPRYGRKRAGVVPRTLFELLSKHGYALHSLEEVTTLCRYRGCRRLKGQNFLRTLKRGRMERLDASIASIRPARKPSFTFHHALLPHAPWVYMPSGRRYDVGLGDFGRGLAGPPGFHDRFLTLQTNSATSSSSLRWISPSVGCSDDCARPGSIAGPWWW